MTQGEYQAGFAQKSELREGTCYYCGNPGHISPYCPEGASNPKYKWELKKATQNLCSESQKTESQYGSKNHNQLNTKKKIFQQAAHGKLEPKTSFTNKVYSHMC